MGSTASKTSAQLPTQAGYGPQWRRTAQNYLRDANQGKLNCTGRVTLATGANSTRVEDKRAGTASAICFMPTTANAAFEVKQIAVTSQGDGFFVIEHTNNAIADRTFVYAILG